MCSATASKKKRNFILDQTNVYPSARRRKMRNFKGFIRRAAILVPDDNELKRRSDKRTYEDGIHLCTDWLRKYLLINPKWDIWIIDIFRCSILGVEIKTDTAYNSVIITYISVYILMVLTCREVRTRGSRVGHEGQLQTPTGERWKLRLHRVYRAGEKQGPSSCGSVCLLDFTVT